jgi:ubiquinone/menaquinone biosynthesis C-methylase UbiE
MPIDATKDHLATLKLHADHHEVIKDSDFGTVEEYVLHLMHESDYQRAATLARGKTVLDLGCNGGHGTSIVGKTCHHVTGVDVSASAIAAAQAKHASDKVRFRLVDGITLPFPSQSFDLVTSCQVIEHLVDYEVYLREIQRVLKPAGLLLVTTPNAAIRVHPGQKPWNAFHVREFRANELQELLQRHFASTRVLGQFATPATYEVEYNRCINARGSLPVRRSLAERAVRKLWRLAVGAPRIIGNRLKAGGADRSPASFQAKHSAVDFHYRTADLDSSLSLVACCSSDEAVAAEAAGVFLQGC